MISAPVSQGHMTLSHGAFSTRVDLSLYAYNHQPYDVSQLVHKKQKNINHIKFTSEVIWSTPSESNNNLFNL